MPKLVTKKFKVHLADSFQRTISGSQDNFYVFYSRIHQWPSESAPPTPVDTVQFTNYDIWRGMVGLKKISNNDISFAITRYNWTSNTLYTEYNNLDSTLVTKPYYVYTANNNVYKCLYNNNGTRSTAVPTGQSTSVITTSDGYKWKFMYNITSAQEEKFVTLNFLPVKTLTSDDSSPQWNVQQAASNGAIEVIDVTASGLGYLESKGTFAGVTNTSVMFANVAASNTSNDYQNYTLFVSSGDGAGQIKTIQSYDGSTKKITLSSPFSVSPSTSSTYHIGPAINIYGDGSSASAYANVINGSIQRVTAINVGENYSHASANVTHYGAARGQGATLIPYLSPLGGHGSDPVDELCGSNIIINTTVDGTENGKFVANNDFRVYGLIKNPVVKATGAVADNLRYDQTLKLDLVSESGSFVEDEFVSGQSSSAAARIVAYDANTLYLTNVTGSFSNVENITANTSGVTARINSITLPDMKLFSGELMYVVNQVAISRDIDQTENITITVKF